MAHPIKTLLTKRQSGAHSGIYSTCTANETVIEAVCERAQKTGTLALVEATANQVNQFGGYTGMRPADFADMVKKIASKTGLSEDMLILGGDHLGPLTWAALPEEEAMKNAVDLVAEFAAAGFTKIHLDTSMKLGGDDPNTRLSDEVIARRAAVLAQKTEEVFAGTGAERVYCVGSEVPIPGGAQEAESVEVTAPEDFRASVSAFKQAFESAGASSAWERVVGVVVQPGVEFGDDSVEEYDATKAAALVRALGEYPGLVFEGHSTDYQTKTALRAMVRDGIAILKVGPGLTFALREGYMALEGIEKALLPLYPALAPSDYTETLDEVMLESPGNWKKYYHGTEAEQSLKRIYSFSDRCRYYFPDKAVREAGERLLSNLSHMKIPLSVLSTHMPRAYTKVREGALALSPYELLKDRVKDCIDEYLFATAL